MRIALFGLSGNPPTGLGGHQGVVRALVRSSLYDEVWVLPVYRHMFCSKRELIPFEYRVEMCLLCFEPESSAQCAVRVLPLEKEVHEHLSSQHGQSFSCGTIDIIDYLKDKIPDSTFTLVLGSDTFADLCNGKWKQSERILSEVKITVFNRMGLPTNVSIDYRNITNITMSAPNVTLLNVESLTDVSSTIVRSLLLAANSTEMIIDGNVLHPDVLRYIQTHNLYRSES